MGIESGVAMQTTKSIFREHELVVLKQRLNGYTLLLHVGHFALERHWAHYRRCEDNGEVEWRHEILRFMLDDARKVEY